MKLGIALKFTLILFLTVSFASLVATWYATNTVSTKLQEEITSKLANDNFFILGELARFFFERQSDMELLISKENKILNLDLHTIDEMIPYLRDFEKNRKAYASMSIYDTRGIRRGDTRGLKIGHEEKDKPFFKHAIEGDLYIDPRPVTSESLGVPVIHFSAPLRNSNNTITGVLVTRIPLTKISDIVREASFPFLTSEINVDLLSEDGLVLFSNHNRGTILKERLVGLPIYKQLRKSNNEFETLIEEFEDKSVLYVAKKEEGFLGYKGQNWILLLSVDTDDIFNPVRELQSQSLLIAILALFIALPLAFFAGISITKPIIALRDAAKEIAGGKLEYPVKNTSQDEVGELSRAFEQMVDELKNSQSKIEKHQHELEGQVKERTLQLEANVKELELSKKATLNIMSDMEETNKKLITAQQQLRENVKQLKQLDVQKDQFISIAAHELKTPMTSIKGFADLLQKKAIVENPSLREKYLGIIFKDTKRLAELLSNILELSRMDIGTLKLAYQKIDIHELIKEIKEQMNIIITSKGLKSVYDIEPHLPSISMDKDRIIQVISNLINNAVHYTDQGVITVSAKKIGINILFTVSDTGSGIPRDQFQKIFERFYQVDNPLTRKIGGTGLGLSLCKGFVESMGGRIWVESELNRGSQFSFTLPIEPLTSRDKEVHLFKKTETPLPVEDLEKNPSTEPTKTQEKEIPLDRDTPVPVQTTPQHNEKKSSTDELAEKEGDVVPAKKKTEDFFFD